MKIDKYLDEVKQRLKIESDYELAKRLGIGRGSLSDMKKGNRAVPLDVAFKIAIALELDPATVVADLEAQREKNPTRKGFWEGFLMRAAHLAVLCACTLALSFGVSYETAQASGGLFRRPRAA